MMSPNPHNPNQRLAYNSDTAIMHIIDSLDIGGAEKMTVNIVNNLPRDRFLLHLCTTRHNGILNNVVNPDVNHLSLQRKHTFDLAALMRLIHYIWKRRIRLVHAHSASVFIAAIASLFPPFPQVIWHVHYGKLSAQQRPSLAYRIMASKIRGVITVNQPLKTWAHQVLRIPENRVWYIPNFSNLQKNLPASLDLPGIRSMRIVCLANLRPEKDPLTLIQAMEIVVKAAPGAQLILVGKASDTAYEAEISAEIRRLGLEQTITWLGQRQDIGAILHSCSIGVLSSASEGLPLALIEYGLAGLAVVSTRVGQCAEVLDEGRAGLLVPPARPDKLAAALISLLKAPELCEVLATHLHAHIHKHYSADAVISQVTAIYDQILNHSGVRPQMSAS